jgi:EAL domain-containing protein (putative c-di-GMP-specific phosphodiesterase class I)
MLYLVSHFLAAIGVSITLYNQWEMFLERTGAEVARDARISQFLLQNKISDSTRLLDITNQQLHRLAKDQKLNAETAHDLLSRVNDTFSIYGDISTFGILLLTDREGKLIARSDAASFKPINFADRYWYQNVVAHPEHAFTVGPLLVARTTKKKIFHISTAVNDANNHLLCVLAIQVNADNFENALSGLLTNRDDIGTVFNKAHEIVFTRPLLPSDFISIAEESGLIVPIGEFVLRESCLQAARWHRQGMPFGTMAVNLSSLQFSTGHLQKLLPLIIAETGLPPDRLEMELTESILMKDTEETRNCLEFFESYGIKVAIDDFGTGYSSLAYLRRFKVHKLKIDQSFVRHLLDDQESEILVRAIIQMARSLNLETLAEGIENEVVAAKLSAMGCDSAQGSLYGRAMTAKALESIWSARPGRN